MSWRDALDLTQIYIYMYNLGLLHSVFVLYKTFKWIENKTWQNLHLVPSTGDFNISPRVDMWCDIGFDMYCDFYYTFEYMY